MKKEGFYHTKETVNQYIDIAKGYDGRQLINRLSVYLKKGATVLELGTGPGVDLDILKESYEATGSDFSKEFIKRYLDKNPKADVLELNAATLDTDRKFDAIYTNKVLHHLSDDDLHQSTQRQTTILSEGGIICHSFWKGENEELMHGLRFNNQTKKSLEGLFGTQYEILEMELYTEMEQDDSIYLIGKKK